MVLYQINDKAVIEELALKFIKIPYFNSTELNHIEQSIIFIENKVKNMLK